MTLLTVHDDITIHFVVPDIYLSIYIIEKSHVQSTTLAALLAMPLLARAAQIFN